MQHKIKYLKVKLVLGCVSIIAGLLAANLALFHWVERTGLYHLFGEFSRYVCAYCGFGAMIFGATLINDFLVLRKFLKGKYVDHGVAIFADVEKDEEKQVVAKRKQKNRKHAIAVVPFVIFLLMLCPITFSLVSYTATVVITPESLGGWTTPSSVHDHCGQVITLWASNTIDDDLGTYWAHLVNERHWIIFDLGEKKTITKVRVHQGAYKLLDVNCYVSDNPADWGTAVFTDWDPPDTNDWNESPGFSKSGRYIRLDNMWTTYPLHFMYKTFYEFDALA